MSDWKRLFAATAVAAGLAAGAASTASACAHSDPLPAEVLAADAEIEGQAWRDAPLVYLARVTRMGPRNEYFELTPALILKGEARPPVVNRPPDPSRGQCLIYHGLNMEDGASAGDEFVVYSFAAAPTAESRMLIVSPRQLGDRTTRRALERARRRPAP